METQIQRMKLWTPWEKERVKEDFIQYVLLPPVPTAVAAAVIITGVVAAISSWCLRTQSRGSQKPPAALTHEKLAVELQAGVPVSWGRLGLARVMTHLKGRFFNIPVCPHVVPPIVIRGSGRLYCDLTRPIPHIKGKGYFCWGWK